MDGDTSALWYVARALTKLQVYDALFSSVHEAVMIHIKF